MALQGNTILELAREKKVNNRIKREVVKRIEKHNAITPWGQNVVTKGNIGMLIPSNKIMPIKQWFEGCLLTDNPNDASLSMIAGNSNVTAQAGNDAYSGTYQKRGSFNASESGIISSPNSNYEGFRFVWDWLTNQGNGRIASIGLTKHQFGIAEISDGDITATGTGIDDTLFDSGDVANLLTGRMTIVDWEKEIGYFVSYSNGVITVEEYLLSTKQMHFMYRFPATMPQLLATHTITQTVADYARNNVSISYTGNAIHFITWNGGTINDYEISTSTWEVTSRTRTFSGVTFSTYLVGYYNDYLQKDVCPIVGDYVFMLGVTNSVLKMFKCNLLGSSEAEIFEYELPSGIMTFEQGNINGVSALLPNGDIYKFSSRYGAGENEPCLYFHNDKFYVARCTKFGRSQWGNGNNEVSLNANAYGDLLGLSCQGNSTRYMLKTMFPYVSTVNNLDSAVIKSADLTMKLTYEITEIAS